MKNWKRLFLAIGLVLACAALLLSAAAESNGTPVPIDPANFPDDIFRAYVSEKFDANSDGTLSETEAMNAKSISLNWKGITSLAGIKNFTRLEVLECQGNRLTDLDMIGCTTLIDLDCSSNQLETLVVDSCAQLKTLDCNYNRLSALDVSKCIVMEQLYCNDNKITELYVNNCKALRELQCDDNQLIVLDVSNCEELRELQCCYNQLSNLNVNGCAALEGLYCQDNQLGKLDVSSCKLLKWLDCPANCLNTLDVRECEELLGIDCHDNQLTTLLLPGKSIFYLNAKNNSLSSLDILRCPMLLRFYTEEYYSENDGNICYGDDVEFGFSCNSGVVINDGEKPYVVLNVGGIKYIETEAFENTGINILYLEECESIGGRAFADCKGLHIVNFEGCEPQIADDAFEGCENLCFFTYSEVIQKWADEHGITWIDW